MMKQKSNFGLYGLISKRGVPSNISTPLIVTIFFSTLTNSTTERPILLGCIGVLVENTPLDVCVLSLKGMTESFGSLTL